MQVRDIFRLSAVGAGFLAAYLVATHLGLLLRVDFGGLTPLWPASGVGLVLLLLRGVRWWPLIVLGESATAWSLGQPLTMGLVGGLAQALEAVFAATLVNRLGIRDWFQDVRATIRYCVLVCMAAPVAGASVGTVGQLVHGLIDAPTWQAAWFTWWLGDAMGLLIVAPFLMTWRGWPFRHRRRALEWLAVSALLCVAGLVLILALGERGDLLFFLLLPFVAWLALDFRSAGATSAAVILAALVFGLSGGSEESFRTAVYIGFVGASAFTGYVLAAVLNRQSELGRQLRHRADHDAVTGIYNRSRLEAELRRLTGHADTRRKHALIYFDLDHFKLVNDTCGHETGDRLLRGLAERLSAFLPDGVTFARLGGDEFGLLVHDADELDAEALAERVRRSLLDYRFTSGEYTFSLGVSIGIAHFAAGETAAAVLSRADIACYAAKDEGRDRVHVYRSEDLSMKRHHSELEWVSQFQRAMTDGQLVLYGQRIQPVVARDEPPFYEVLLRRMEQGRPVSPARFLPVAARYGLMPAIDRWVMEKSFRTLADNPGEVRLSINLAAATLDRPRFQERVEALVSEFGVDPGRICFEVTETIAIRNMTRAVDAIRRLSESGFRFALDDFGTGVASFGYLNQLPVHLVKVDGQFVRTLDKDTTSRIIVSSLNDIARLRGIQCVAEWVESAAVMQELKRIGVAYAQGYHLHVPAPLDDLLGVEARRESG